MFDVATFYHFTRLNDLPGVQVELVQRAQAAKAYGTILIAPEGINATIASNDKIAFRDLIAWIMNQFQIAPENLKWSSAKDQPFQRLKVRIKRETITMKRPSVDVVARTGTHVSAQEWNDLVTAPDILLLDTRNTYETAMGTFKNAVVPPLNTFSEFADYVDGLDPTQHPRVAMFCTGGIRCEKASSYMLEKGFKDVYQLQGGILKYLETVQPDQSLWEGDCFVFDERVTLGHGLTEKKRDRV